MHVPRDATDRSDDVEHHSLDQEAKQTLEEARTVVPGIQALFGFQLIVAFHPKYDALAPGLKLTHLIALLAIALALALIMAPAAYHRIAERGRVSRYLIELASRLIALAMVPLMFAVSMDTYLICQVVLDTHMLSAVISGSVLAVFAWAWFGFPLLRARSAR